MPARNSASGSDVAASRSCIRRAALRAVAQLEEALRLEPAYAEACYNLGNVLKEMNRRDEAISI